MSGPDGGERGVAERPRGGGRIDHHMPAAELGLAAKLPRDGPLHDRMAVAAAEIEERIFALALDRRHQRLDQHSRAGHLGRQRVVRAEQEGVVRRGRADRLHHQPLGAESGPRRRQIGGREAAAIRLGTTGTPRRSKSSR